MGNLVPKHHWQDELLSLSDVRMIYIISNYVVSYNVFNFNKLRDILLRKLPGIALGTKRLRKQILVLVQYIENI